jgi:hypothetical protein
MDFLCVEFDGEKLVEVEVSFDEIVEQLPRQQRRACLRRYADFRRQYGMPHETAAWHALSNTIKTELPGNTIQG